jgi:ferritin-like metal-binding protein YciE
MAIDDMDDLLVEELRDIYSAERIALRVYPRLRRVIRTQSLREAVDRHVEQTQEQVQRLDQIFEIMDERVGRTICHAMQSLAEDAQEHLEANMPDELLEVVMVADLQKIEHFEIAAYGSARAHAQALGLEEAAELLAKSLEEEKQTDALLNELAEREINPQAVAADQDEGDEQEEGAEDEGEEDEDEAQQERSSGQRRRAAASSTGRSQRKTASSKGGDDLNSREHGDAQGNVHHHTRTGGKRG